MKKAPLDFILVASSIYHSVFFLDLPLVMSDGLAWGSLFETTRDPQPLAACVSCSLVTLYPAVRPELHRLGQSNSCGQGCCFSSGWCKLEGSGLPEPKVFLSKKVQSFSTRILAAAPWILSPKPPNPVSPQASLVYSASPLSEPRVSDWKWNFICWPFKRLCVSSFQSLAERNPDAFHSWMLSGFLPSSGAICWGAQLGV